MTTRSPCRRTLQFAADAAARLVRRPHRRPPPPPGECDWAVATDPDHDRLAVPSGVDIAASSSGADDVEVVSRRPARRGRVVRHRHGDPPGIAGGAATTAAPTPRCADAATVGRRSIAGRRRRAGIRSAFGTGLDIQSLSIAGVGPPDRNSAWPGGQPGFVGRQIGILPGPHPRQRSPARRLHHRHQPPRPHRDRRRRIGALTARQATVYWPRTAARSEPRPSPARWCSTAISALGAVELSSTPGRWRCRARSPGDIVARLTVKNLRGDRISSTAWPCGSGEAEVLGRAHPSPAASRTSGATSSSSSAPSPRRISAGSSERPDRDFLQLGVTDARHRHVVGRHLGQPQTVMLNLELRNGAFVRTGTAALSLRVTELAISGTGRFEFVVGGFPNHRDRRNGERRAQLTKLSARLYPAIGGRGRSACRRVRSRRAVGHVAWQSSPGGAARSAAAATSCRRAGDFASTPPTSLSAAGFELTATMLGRVSGMVFADAVPGCIRPAGTVRCWCGSFGGGQHHATGMAEAPSPAFRVWCWRSRWPVRRRAHRGGSGSIPAGLMRSPSAGRSTVIRATARSSSDRHGRLRKGSRLRQRRASATARRRRGGADRRGPT